jgi:hypothetical protein
MAMGGALVLLALSLQAAPNVWDNFESYDVGTDFATTHTNGWNASTNTVIVSNLVWQTSTKSVVLPDQSTLTNTVSGSGGKAVWTDLWIIPTLGDPPSSPPTNTASFVQYFDANGFVEVATTSGWTVCSNDVWGNSVPAVSNAFVRVTLFQDYSTSNQALMINGQLILQDQLFLGSSHDYTAFGVRGTGSNVWMDNVWINTNYDTVTLTNDFNGNHAPDAAELATYGYVARTQYVGGVGYPSYGSIQLAVNAWRSRDAVYISSSNAPYAENVVVSNAITFTGGIFTNTGTLTVRSTNAAVFQAGMKWETVNLDTNSTSIFSQGLVCSNLIIRSGATVTVANVTCSNLVVEPGAHFVCNGPFQCSGSSTIGQGAVVVFAGSVTNPGTFSVASGASVTLGQGASLGAFIANGTITVGAGQTVSANSAAVSGGLQVSGAGTVSVGTTLSVTGAGVLTFTNSTLSVPASAVNMSGTFTIDSTWGPSVSPMPLPFTDTFELYADSTQLQTLGFRGWCASSAGVVVQSQEKYAGSKAVCLPDNSTLSNLISAASTKVVATDLYWKPIAGDPPQNPPTNTSSFVAYVNSNCQLVVATSTGWEICSNSIIDGSSVTVSTGNWSRITFYQNFSRHQFCVYVDGKLVKDAASFPGSGIDSYSSLGAKNDQGSAYFDNIMISTDIPSDLSLSDNWRTGSIFKIR